MKRIHFFYFLMILTCRNAKQNKLWNKSWQCLSLEFQTVHKNYFPIIYTVCGLYCVSLNSDLALWPNILHRPCVSGAKVALEGLRWLNSNCSLAVDPSTKIVLWVMLSNKRSSAGQPVRHLQKQVVSERLRSGCTDTVTPKWRTVLWTANKRLWQVTFHFHCSTCPTRSRYGHDANLECMTSGH